MPRVTINRHSRSAFDSRAFIQAHLRTRYGTSATRASLFFLRLRSFSPFLPFLRTSPYVRPRDPWRVRGRSGEYLKSQTEVRTVRRTDESSFRQTAKANESVWRQWKRERKREKRAKARGERETKKREARSEKQRRKENQFIEPHGKRRRVTGADGQRCVFRAHG